jgi:hypothetical protein
MTDFSFKIFPTIPDVPYKAQNGDDGLSIYVTSKIEDSSSITLNLSDGTIVIIPKGIDGVDGRGISSVIRTSGDGSAGSLDTYTIT